MNRKFYLTLAISIFILFLGWGVWNFWLQVKPIACTADALQCPDGTYVGRVPPKCEFSKCQGESGTVTGKVTVGPLCPVEPCTESIDFSSRQVILESSSGRQLSISLYADGTLYPTKVAPGTYQATLANCIWLGCEGSLPQTVVVAADQTNEVLINIDTGIR